MTHTYAILKVSPETYNEIRGKLAAAGYGDQFHDKATGEVIDMHGIALQSTPPAPIAQCPSVNKMFVVGEGRLNLRCALPAGHAGPHKWPQEPEPEVRRTVKVEIDREAFLRD